MQPIGFRQVERRPLVHGADRLHHETKGLHCDPVEFWVAMNATSQRHLCGQFKAWCGQHRFLHGYCNSVLAKGRGRCGKQGIGVL